MPQLGQAGQNRPPGFVTVTWHYAVKCVAWQNSRAPGFATASVIDADGYAYDPASSTASRVQPGDDT